MKKVLSYFATILTLSSLMGCEKNYSINGVRLIESKFSNQSELETPLKEKFYTINFLGIEGERDGSLRIVSRINGKSLVSVTLIEERNLGKNNLNSQRILSFPVKTFTEECDYESENTIIRKLLDKAKDYRLSEDYSKKAETKIEMLLKNQ